MNRVSSLIIGLVLGLIFGVFTMYAISWKNQPPRISELIAEQGASKKIQVNSSAPDFNLETLEGEQIRLSELRGRVVLINFWATWCGPCRVEMPAFQSRVTQYQDEFVILAINEQDSEKDIQDFVNELNLTFYMLLDNDGVVHKQYFVRGYPTTYLVDEDGLLRFQHIGVMTGEQLDEYLRELGLAK